MTHAPAARTRDLHAAYAAVAAETGADPARLHLPGTEAYAAASVPWNVAVQRHPAAVVAAASAADVQAAVLLAGRLGLQVSVQATGHGAVGDLAGTVLVSTRELRGVVVDATARTARVAAGTTWTEVLDAAAPHGLTGLVGSAPHVGVVGYVTGGGVGPLARTFGLASDRVRSFDLVTGDGRAVRASATEHPELFWGLRGGKGLLGVVTAVELELVELAELYAGAVYFDGADAAAVLHRWAAWSVGLPRQATTSVALLRLPPLPSVPPPLAGRLTVAVRFAWTGDPDEGARLLAELRGVAAPIVDTVAVTAAAAIGAVHADPVDPMPVHETHALLRDLTPAAVDALLAVAGPDAASAQVAVEVRQLGGALAEAPLGGSAYDARSAAYSLMLIGLGAPPVVDAVVADGRAVLDAMEPWATGTGLPNFAPAAGRSWLERTYAAPTLARLARVSREHDPARTIAGSELLDADDRSAVV